MKDTALRLIVCGGRNYHNKKAIWIALDDVHLKYGIAAIIQGAADGADRWAAEWGWEHQKDNVLVCSYPADWQKEGKSAGPKRNARMIAESNPNGVIAFPGGVGTADMIKKAKTADLLVWQPEG